MPSRMDDLVKMLISGKPADPAPLPDSDRKKGKGVKTLPFIEAGQTVEHNGGLHVTGPIGAGAIVKVKKGGLLVDGEVGDGASITVEDESTNHVIVSGRGGNVSISNITISGSSRVTINGRDVTEELRAHQAEKGPEGLTVKGIVGAGVSLHSSHDVTLEQLAASNLTVRAGRDITARNIGKGAELSAGRDVKLSVLFANSAVNTGRDATVEKIDETCILSSGRDADVGSIEARTQVTAGRDVTIGTANSTGPIRGGRDVEIALGHKDLQPAASRRATVKQRLPH